MEGFFPAHSGFKQPTHTQADTQTHTHVYVCTLNRSFEWEGLSGRSSLIYNHNSSLTRQCLVVVGAAVSRSGLLYLVHSLVFEETDHQNSAFKLDTSNLFFKKKKRHRRWIKTDLDQHLHSQPMIWLLSFLVLGFLWIHSVKHSLFL